MSGKYAFKKDVKEALAMAETFSHYVRGNALYGKTSMFSSMPSVTAGALLMRLRRLDLLRDQMKDHETKNLDKAIDYFEAVRQDWRHHYEGKLQKEAHSRIDAMRGFFYECGENIRNCIGIYKPEILRRTIVQEILRELEDLHIEDSDLTGKIKVTDNRLHNVTEPTDFQWADILKPVYPRDEFWWLYKAPPNLP